MPVFQPRNRVQITREMVARVVARSKLTGLQRNSAAFHIIAAAANEDAEQYVQMARLRAVFSIDNASGSDLDARAAEIVPGIIRRRSALPASGNVIFSRPGTTGSLSIPAGTQVGATDDQGQVRFRTTVAGTIPNGSTTSGVVNVTCSISGIRGNVIAGQINQMVTRVAGVTAVTNPTGFSNGQDRESDTSFRARLKAFVQAISRGTVVAIEGFAKQVITDDGIRALFAKLDEPIIPNGRIDLYVDDGTGSAEEFSETYIGSPDLFLPAAAGGEITAFTTARPIRDDGSFTLEADTGGGFVTLVRGTDYELNSALGQIELISTGSLPVLSIGDALRAEYRFYTGLLAETQQVIDGDSSNPLLFPGVRAAGIQVVVRPAVPIFQSLTGAIAVLPDFDVTTVAADVSDTIQDYINTLDIGEDVIVAEIVERAMGVNGMFNFRIIDLTGSGAGGVDQIILDNQVARIAGASISLT